MKRILYIVDDKADPKSFLDHIRRIKNKEDLSFFICPVTTNNNFISAVKDGLSEFGNTELLPFVEEFNKNAFLYKDRFIKFLSDFSSGRQDGLISLKKHFMHPFDNFSLWWLSLIQEKSTVKKESYHNLAKLVTIVDLLRNYSPDEVYLDIQNRELKWSILRNKGGIRLVLKERSLNNGLVLLAVSLVKAIGYVALFIVRKCIIYFIFRRDRSKKVSSLKNSKFLLVTYFPFREAENRIFNGGIFKSKYFGSLQASLEGRHKDEISWMGILQYSSRLNIKTIKLIKRMNACGYRIFLPEELISLHEVATSTFVFFRACLRFLKIIPYLARRFGIDTDTAGKVNIWDIYRGEWVGSFFDSYLVAGLLYYRIFLNLIPRLQHKAVIMYPAELHAWENALNIARKKHKGVKTIGIQHSSVSLLQLNYFNAPVDLKYEDAIDSFPLPDCLGCSGKIPMQLLINNGWPKEKIFLLGAVRYHGLSSLLKERVHWGSRPKKITVALSHTKFEVEELLSALKQAFHNNNICTFLIKPHILYPLRDIIRLVDSGYFGRNFKLCIDEPLDELMSSSRAVITTGSTASLDGILCQCLVIIPKLSCRVVMNPLSEDSDGFAIYVSNQDELSYAVTSVINSKDSPIEFSKIKPFIDGYFAFADREDEYYLRLENEL